MIKLTISAAVRTKLKDKHRVQELEIEECFLEEHGGYLLAEIQGVGYQPMMREALTRFAEGEARHLVMELASRERQRAAKKEAKAAA